MQKTIKRTHLSFKRACPRSGSEGVAKVERLVSDHRPVECLRWVLEQLCGSVVTAARTGRHWRAALSRFPAACEAFASSRPRAFSDTRPARTCTLHSPALLERLRFSARSSTVRSACRAFELFATAALPYKYGARWRGPAAATLAHDASRSHIGINWRCSQCPPHWFYCLPISYIRQLAQSWLPSMCDMRRMPPMNAVPVQWPLMSTRAQCCR